jgi:apolipoprotein N-acyltransferase
MRFLGLALYMGVIFAGLAAAMAFAVTYDRYRHRFQDSRLALRLAIDAALFAGVFFLALIGLVFAVAEILAA